MAAAHTEGTEVTSWQWSLDTTPEGLVLIAQALPTLPQ
jgi:hypothetical protein